jgi:hypothetical protein
LAMKRAGTARCQGQICRKICDPKVTLQQNGLVADNSHWREYMSSIPLALWRRTCCGAIGIRWGNYGSAATLGSNAGAPAVRCRLCGSVRTPGTCGYRIRVATANIGIVSSTRYRTDVELFRTSLFRYGAVAPTSCLQKLLLQPSTYRFTGAFNYENTSSS